MPSPRGGKASPDPITDRPFGGSRADHGRRHESITRKGTHMGNRGGGIYIGGGAIALIVIVILLIWLL